MAWPSRSVNHPLTWDDQRQPGRRSLQQDERESLEVRRSNEGGTCEGAAQVVEGNRSEPLWRVVVLPPMRHDQLQIPAELGQPEQTSWLCATTFGWLTTGSVGGPGISAIHLPRPRTAFGNELAIEVSPSGGDHLG
jgi:hypothetical protein